MDQWVGAVAIVTGASSGIGESIATELVKRGLKVVGLARRFDRLCKLKEDLKDETGEFHPLKCDMTVEEDILTAFQWTHKNLGGIDILINNAGTSRNSNLTEGKTSDWKTVIDLNLMGLCISTREAIKIMKENNVAGLIIHINSVAGHYPLTAASASSLNVYGATKYGVTALAETLRLELATKKSKIRVSSISPGFVHTDILNAGGFNLEELSGLLNSVPILSPVDIANAVVYLLSTPPSVNVTELTIRPTGEIL